MTRIVNLQIFGDPVPWGDGRPRVHHLMPVDLLGKKYDAYVRDNPAMLPASVRDKRVAA